MRRLGGVTQVVAVGETPLFHTRLTHTLKVQQLARRLAEHFDRDPAQTDAIARLGGIDAAAAEAAGLAHDLGHPPFGHVGEEVLDGLCQAHGLDGFEGNAQTFRMLTKLASHDTVAHGLGISARTLCAVIKYPNLRAPKGPGAKKWNAYPTERISFDRARAESGLSEGERSLEAAVMDWADDVTYAVHDLEDFIRAGHIPINALLDNPAEMRRFWDASWPRVSGKVPTADEEEVFERFRSMFELAFSEVPAPRDPGRTDGIAAGTRVMIGSYISAARVGDRSEPLEVLPALRAEVEVFKQLTWYYVIHDPRLASLQQGQQTVLKTLFSRLYAWLLEATEDGQLYRLPPRLRRVHELTDAEEGAGWYTSGQQKAARAVSDYIAGLTEQQALDLSQRLTSPRSQSVLDPWMVY
ncbi:hypothetical protein CH259_00420 [Rhodococcus sp. 05-2254-4]|nr:hypothetical protein CH259_00420 [Rhodococcus sp. 05-2254-4]OZE47340.1 hypothetical protein CH261_10180 [Rhodococcus sp. 05-2254-3]OZE47639.1 hypothetical protein CH283_18295 [Rhodococcus sp. 05-2254-2]